MYPNQPGQYPPQGYPPQAPQQPQAPYAPPGYAPPGYAPPGYQQQPPAPQGYPPQAPGYAQPAAYPGYAQPPAGGTAQGYDFGQLYGQADNSSILYTEGPHTAVVEDSEFGATKAGDKGQWTVKVRITDGEHAGKMPVTQTITISHDNPRALGIMFRHLAAFGIPVPDPQNPQQVLNGPVPFWAMQPPMDERAIAAAMKGKPVIVVIKHDEYDGVVRNKIRDWRPAPPGAPTTWPQPGQQAQPQYPGQIGPGGYPQQPAPQASEQQQQPPAWGQPQPPANPAAPQWTQPPVPGQGGTAEFTPGGQSWQPQPPVPGIGAQATAPPQQAPPGPQWAPPQQNGQQPAAQAQPGATPPAPPWAS